MVMIAAAPLVLRRAELGRYSVLHQMSLEQRLPPRVDSDAWRLDRFGDEAAIRIRDWRRGERVLDVGCGFSTLPTWLHENYGVEAWGADDFGADTGYWRRNQDVDAYIQKNPGRYVTELVGNPETSSLPPKAFDCVYSKLGVHFSPPPHANIWRHMELLLSDRPGSDLAVIAGCRAQTERDPNRGLERLDEASAIEDAILDRRRAGVPNSAAFWRGVHARANPLVMSPFIYCAYVMDVLGVPGDIPSELRVYNLCLNPDVLVDPWYVDAKRACFARDPAALRKITFGRTFALVLGFQRGAGA